MSTPNELAAALLDQHQAATADVKRDRERIAEIGRWLEHNAATVTLNRLSRAVDDLSSAGQTLDRHERLVATLLAAAEKLTEQPVSTKRAHTPDAKNPDGSTTITVKRCCNGCGEVIGDITEAEIEAGVNGQPLPDVRDECPRCSTPAGPLTVQPAPGWPCPDDTGPDQAGRMVADTGYPTAPANGPEAAQ